MKRFLIGIVWVSLVLAGIPLSIMVWTEENIPFWLDILYRIPITLALWFFFLMIFDVWMSTKPFGSSKKIQNWDLKPVSHVMIDGKKYIITSYSAHSGGVMDPDGSSEVVVHLEAKR